MATRPVIRGSGADLARQNYAQTTARFNRSAPPPPPAAARPATRPMASAPPPPPTSTATSFSRAPAAAMAVSLNQPWERPPVQLPPAEQARQEQLLRGRAGQISGQAGGTGPGMAAGNRVTAQDMVDVPGVGQLPRALLQNLQTRMQQRQQPPMANVSPGGNAAEQRISATMDTGREADRQQLRQAIASGQMTPQEAEDRFQQMQTQRLNQLRGQEYPGYQGPPGGGARPGQPRDPALEAKVAMIRQAVQSGQMSDADGQNRLNAVLANAYTASGGVGARPNDNRFGPPVSGRPVVDQGAMWNSRHGNPAVPPAAGGPFSSYGNDNIGLGVTQPTMLSQPPGERPITPIGNQPPVMNPAPPAPPPPPPTMNTGPSVSPNKPFPPGVNPMDAYWDAQKGDWQVIDRAAAQAKALAAAAPPPPPGPSPFAAQNWGGGPAAFGAGPNPNPWAGPGTSPYFGPSMPNLPPAAQQSYQQAWATDLNRDPYQTGGAVYNGAPQAPAPSWY